MLCFLVTLNYYIIYKFFHSGKLYNTESLILSTWKYSTYTTFKP